MSHRMRFGIFMAPFHPAVRSLRRARVQGQAHSTRDADARARAARPVLAEHNLAAVAHASEVYQAELAAKAKG
jgi:hypothetical protein